MRLHRKKISLLFQLSIVLSITACTQRPPEWKDIVKTTEVNSRATASPVPTTNELVVYLDTSASMAGYITKDGQSIFGKTLRELRYATGTFGNSDAKVLVRRIASAVGPALTDMELTSASQDQNIYHGGETNLAGAITTFKSPTTPAKAAEQSANTQVGLSAAPKVEPIPKFHVLVTDGVQSTKQGGATHECAAGSDQFCVRQKIGELLRAGWGGCILGLRADFHGKVYSEVNGSAIPYETRTSDPKTFRPFYLYIFSPDPSALDSLVTSLKDRLRPLLPQSEPIRELNLSFSYATGTTDFDVAVPKDSKSFIDHNKDHSGPPSKLTLRVDVDTEKSGAKPFSILAKLPWSTHALDTANETELTQFLTWSVERVYPPDGKAAGQRFPEIRILHTHVDTPGQITIDATAGYPSGTAKPSWCAYHLRARLNLNQSSPAWIKEWSIDLDTTRDVGNRTFNLETALLGLWNTSDTKERTVAEAYIRIGPK
jgi:hypothetical protein